MILSSQPLRPVRSWILLGLVFLFAAASAPARAQDVALTSDSVGKFITSLKEIREIDKKHGGSGALSERNGAGAGNGWDPFDGAAKSLRAHAAYDEIKDAIGRAGYASPEAWAAAGSRIYRAYGALKLGPKQGEMNSQMTKAKQQVMQSKMSEAQKKQMLAMIDQQMSMLSNFQNVPDGDKQAVSPYMDALEKMNQ